MQLLFFLLLHYYKIKNINLLQQAVYDKYAECSKLEPVTETVKVENGEIQLDITLDPHAAVVYEVTPV